MLDPTGKHLSLSVILPARNEEGTLKSVVEEVFSTFEPLFSELKIIIVNDGSTDRTKAIADGLASQYSNILVVDHQESQGVGGAYKTAFSFVDTDYVTWFPTDGEISLVGMENIIGYMDGETVLVTYPSDSFEKRSLFRRMLSRAFVVLMNIFFRKKIRYYNGSVFYPVKAFHLDQIRSRGFFFNAETLIKVLRNGRLKVVQVPFVYRRRASGGSKAIKLVVLMDVMFGFLRLLGDEICYRVFSQKSIS